jgi:hypothetical protein
VKTKTIEIVADDMLLYQFLKYYVKRDENGEYVCNGEFLHHIKPLPIKFLIENTYEIFNIINWGGWNQCPNNKTLIEKLKVWFDIYGAELTGLSHDTLYFKCNTELEETEVDTLVQDIIEFCPGSIDVYKYRSEREMKKLLLEEQRFILWWD